MLNYDITDAEKELIEIYKLRGVIQNPKFLSRTELFLCEIISNFYNIEPDKLSEKLREMFAATGSISTEEIIAKGDFARKYEYIDIKEDKERYVASVTTNEYGNIFFGALSELMHFAHAHGMYYTEESIFMDIFNLRESKITLGNIYEEDEESFCFTDAHEDCRIRLELILWKPGEGENESSCHFDINIIDEEEAGNE